MKVAILGGGAAGFFAAISVSENFPDAEVVLFEKTQKLLSKVKVSGGGRCNVTTSCESINDLILAYPRGGKQLKHAFHVFNNQHTIEWFKTRGVELYTQQDGRMFPISDSSTTIMDCLLNVSRRNGVQIIKGCGIDKMTHRDDNWVLSSDEQENLVFNKVIVAVGGSPKKSGLEWLETLGHKIADPVPSLFTFNMPNETIRELMGVSVPEVLLDIQGTKLKSQGPIMITHWGMSGPSILQLSAFGARILNEKNYDFKLRVNWANEKNDQIVLDSVTQCAKANSQKLLSNGKPIEIPDRLWQFLLLKCALDPQKKWGELGSKGFNKLVNILTNDLYSVLGKTTFKEEFVTCGGVDLSDINMKTMESKVCPGIYFSGEIMDIDGITGGYNFQAAWTTAFIAGQLN